MVHHCQFARTRSKYSEHRRPRKDQGGAFTGTIHLSRRKLKPFQARDQSARCFRSRIFSPLIMVAVILKFKADDMDEPIKSQLLAFLDQLPARPQTAFASRNATRCFSFAHLRIATNSGRSQQSTILYIRNKCLLELGVMVVPL